MDSAGHRAQFLKACLTYIKAHTLWVTKATQHCHRVATLGAEMVESGIPRPDIMAMRRRHKFAGHMARLLAREGAARRFSLLAFQHDSKMVHETMMLLTGNSGHDGPYFVRGQLESQRRSFYTSNNIE